jgi:hypothetical protein
LAGKEQPVKKRFSGMQTHERRKQDYEKKDHIPKTFVRFNGSASKTAGS